jgi:3-hydroxyacyl-CoA dehydrogenase/enoyl-CoA hydratase/3-hydroxybutyryl-CoA epimerase
MLLHGPEGGLPEGTILIRVGDRESPNLTPDVLNRLAGDLEEAASAAPRLLALAGVEPGRFGLGLDLAALQKPDGVGQGYLIPLQAASQPVLERLQTFPAPTVAVLDGAALGASLTLALACDARCATTGEGTLFGFPELGLRLLPALGGMVYLARIVGPVRAGELLASGRRVPARQAASLGLVDEGIPDGAEQEWAIAWGLANASLLMRFRGKPRRFPQGKTWMDRWMEGTRAGRRALLRRLRSRLKELDLPETLLADLMTGLGEAISLPLQDALAAAREQAGWAARSPEAAERLDAYARRLSERRGG